MPGHQYTPAVYALQKIVKSFGNLLSELAEHNLTHTNTVEFPFCQYNNIDYLVLIYSITGTFLLGEFPKELLFENEAYCRSILETVSGTVLNWSFWKKQR
jgi:hypothetical protein